jgi:hypothetical protein
VKPSNLPSNQPASAPESLTKARVPRAPLPPIDSVLGYRIDDAVKVSGLSRATLYRLIKEKVLRSKLVAGRRLITPDALRELFDAAA